MSNTNTQAKNVLTEAVYLRPAVEDVTASYIPRRRHRMTILVCQHKQSFCAVRSLMHNEGQRRFFGQRIDGVMYGQHDALVHPGMLASFERRACQHRSLRLFSRRAKVAYLYWGDVDSDSVQHIMQLYRANPGRNIRPFMPAYRCMLDRARGRTLRPANVQAAGSFRIRLAKRLGGAQRSLFEQVMAQGLRIPQQVLDKQVLRAHKAG